MINSLPGRRNRPNEAYSRVESHAHGQAKQRAAGLGSRITSKPQLGNDPMTIG
jgi:hypothetical protein